MNIKDIAKIAGVSASTVSKVVNGKDQTIGAETRERILKIVKEYNYKPYETIKNGRGERAFVLGVLVRAVHSSNELLMSMFKTARECGYGTIVYASSSPEEERKNLLLLNNHQVDGVVWERLENSDVDVDFAQRELGVPLHLIDYRQPPSESNSIIGFNKLAFCACEELVRVGHRRILCYTDLPEDKNALFEAGFKECLQKSNIAFTPRMCKRKKARLDNAETLLFEYTAVLCSSLSLALGVYEECVKKNRKVPQYLSIISLQEEGLPAGNITTLEVPANHLGQHALHSLISVLEKKAEPVSPMETPLVIHDGGSVGHVQSRIGGRIVVVGSINMDILLSVDTFPRPGETVPANGCGIVPGGKGVNQAIGAARLGAEVFLIGKMGKDFDGSRIHDYLYRCGVNTDGIFSTAKESTGAAYIHVRRDGESQIVIYKGANQRLTAGEIESREKLFEGASFCLVQTELQENLVMQAVQTAKRQGVPVLLKPAAVKALSPQLYKDVDILLPNEKEAATLCPQHQTVEEQAAYFMACGVKTVIITLGNKGCYVKTAEWERHYPAAPFEAVDTTGAADAFASALAVYLSRKRSLHTAVRYATYAAGYSVTKQGVPPAMIDAMTLEFYMSAAAQEEE